MLRGDHHHHLHRHRHHDSRVSDMHAVTVIPTNSDYKHKSSRDLHNHSQALDDSQEDRHDSPPWCKSLRLILVGFALVAMIVQITLVVVDYFKYPTTTSIRFQYVPDVNFPAVSLCNVNPIRKSLLPTVDPRVSDLFVNTSETMAKIVDDMDILGGSDTGNTMAEFRKQFNYESFETRVNYSNVGHQLSDMLLTCSFQETPCSYRNFTRWSHAQYGNCYTFVAKQDATGNDEFAAFSGSRYGLTVLLNAQSEQYLPIIDNEVGYRIHVHAPESPGFPEALGIFASARFQTSIGLQEHFNKRKSLPYDGTECGSLEKANIYTSFYQYWKSFTNTVSKLRYSADACFNTCYYGKQQQSCACVDANAVSYWNARDSNGPVKACDFQNHTVNACFKKVLEETLDPTGECSEGCPPACHERSYATQATSSPWPSASFSQAMKRTSSEEMNKLALKQAESLVRVQVYFQQLTQQLVEETEKVSFFTMLSNVGGTAGLYCGLSLLGLFDGSEYFVKWFRKKFMQKKL